MRGESTEDFKPYGASNHSTMSVSSRALDLASHTLPPDLVVGVSPGIFEFRVGVGVQLVLWARSVWVACLKIKNQDQKPLTLALSRRERGLTVGDVRATPTCNTESNASLKANQNRLPLPRERAGVRGESTEDFKPYGASNHSTMSVSSRALDLASHTLPPDLVVGVSPGIFEFRVGVGVQLVLWARSVWVACLKIKNQDQKPLTLALSRRERGLTVGDGRATPTCNTESNASLEANQNRLPLPRERAGVRGESTANLKPCAASHHSIGRVSARLLLILIHRRRRKAERRDRSGRGSAATVWRSQTQRKEVQRSKP
ncbi:hypothetical protein SAMN05216579_2066 [Pseudomonas granadensis]|nr:hypothetical protein SAMN05216579_2066 [Pseudomonas granadensis]